MPRALLLLAPVAWVVIYATATVHAASPPGAPDFNRDIRPLLAKHCLACHGPDAEAREADLRLDDPESAVADRGGYAALKPGDAEASEMLRRIIDEDPDTRMPPAEHGPPLSETEVSLLSDWIDAGAHYDRHWAFVPPRQPTVPDVQRLPDGSRSAIDSFVLRQLEAADLTLSEPASRHALIRRLYLDLTGLAPTPEQVDRFVADDSPKALRRLVDELLASPDYGVHVATPWLDLARYADSNGYEKDRPRTIWPYRDWVINARNADQPFDQFSIEQLAGDMLPHATEEQRIATGFHRNTMLNEEGGIDPLEYRYHAMIDRVGTTGTIWMGLTVACAQCHTHKYDPITHDDFYSLYALLNQADEPELELRDAAVLKRREQLAAEICAAEDELIETYLDARPATSTPAKANRDVAVKAEQVREDFEGWLKLQLSRASDWKVLQPTQMKATTPSLSLTESGSVLVRGDITKREVYELTFPAPPAGERYTAIRLEALPHESLPAGGPGMGYYEGRRGDFFLSELTVTSAGAPVPLHQASHSFGKITVGSGSADAAGVIDADGSTGWSTATHEGRANRLVINLAAPLSEAQPWTIKLLFERHFAAPLGHFRISATTRTDAPVVASQQEASLEQQLSETRQNVGEIPPRVLETLRRQYIRSTELLASERKAHVALNAELPELTRTLVMNERPSADRRPTHRHHRGEYLQPRETVEPGIPALFATPSDSQPGDRLEFARWLVSDANPIVARATVNRAWRLFFGNGLVRTAGDYGTQSEPPTHPELLDWLAVDLADNGWSLKRLHRKIALSATYRQRVAAPPESDPENRLLACHPYRRLQAEQIRDSFLSAAGVLVRQAGGPGVYPKQPTGVAELAYGGDPWPTSAGADLYRRSIYTFRKRTAPFAAFAVFDAPTGEVCLARRQPSTTPLQSLTLLNDELFIDLARMAARDVLREFGDDGSPEQIATQLFRRILARAPEAGELAAMIQFFNRSTGDAPATASGSPEERWTWLARAIFNTDEAITIP